MKQTEQGNMAFMATMSAFAILGATGVAVLGFTPVSLALIIVCSFFGTFVAVMVENHVNKRVTEKQKQEIEEAFKE